MDNRTAKSDLPSVFIIDDDATTLCALAAVLSRDYRVRTFDDPTLFAAEVRLAPPDVVICDKHIGPTSHEWVRRFLQDIVPNPEVILYSGDSAESVSIGTGTGIFACLSKGAYLREIAVVVAAAAKESQRSRK